MLGPATPAPPCIIDKCESTAKSFVLFNPPYVSRGSTHSVGIDNFPTELTNPRSLLFNSPNLTAADYIEKACLAAQLQNSCPGAIASDLSAVANTYMTHAQVEVLNAVACQKFSLWNGGDFSNRQILREDLKFVVEAIFPNPTHQLLNISMITAPDAELQFEIISGEGKIIRRETFVGGGPKSVEVSELSPGAYTLRIKSGAKVEVHRFIKN